MWTLNIEGYLYHKGRLVVAKIPELRESILIEAHKSKFAVHPGSTKMYQDLKRQYWWEGMKRDVACFVPVRKLRLNTKDLQVYFNLCLYPNGSGIRLQWTL